MIKKVFCLGMIAVLVAGATGAAADAGSAELKDMELTATPDGAQLILDLSTVAPQKIFRLSNPERTVVDLGHTRLGSGVHAPPGDGIVEDVRTGMQPGGTLRVVIRIKSSVNASSAWVPSSSGRLYSLMFICSNSNSELPLYNAFA